MPSAPTQIAILLPVLLLLSCVAMPVIAIALNGKFDSRKRNVNPEGWNRVLAFWCISFGLQRGNQVDFNRTDAGVSLLSKVSIATSRAGTKATDKRRLDLADLAAHLAGHFHFRLVQWVIFAYYRFGFVLGGATHRAAFCFVVWGAFERLAARRANFLDAWQLSVGRLIGAIGAFAGAKLSCLIHAIVHKLFAAFRACARWVVAFVLGVVDTGSALAAAIEAFFGGVVCVEFFAAMGANSKTRGMIGHSNGLLTAVAHVLGHSQCRQDNSIGCYKSIIAQMGVGA